MHQDIFYSNELCRQYSLSLSNRTKQAIRASRRRGVWCSKAPRGYLNIHDRYDHFRPKIVKDPEDFYRVKKAFDLMLTGKYSIPDIGKVVMLDASFLRRAFRNPFYAGLNKDVDDPTIMHKGTWEPMITEEHFYRVQQLLKPKEKTKRLNG